jgi:hypothetical protein
MKNPWASAALLIEIHVYNEHYEAKATNSPLVIKEVYVYVYMSDGHQKYSSQ